MRKLLILLMLILPFVSYCQSQSFEVFGTITGTYNSRVYLFYNDNYKQKDSISAEIKDGKFYIKATAALPIQGRFHLDQQSYIQDVYLDGKMIFLSCTNRIQVHGRDKDTINDFRITGVKGSKTENLKRGFEDWLTALKSSGKTEEEKNKLYYDRLYAFARQNPKTKVSPYLIGKASSLRYSQIKTLSRLIDSTLFTTFEGKGITKLLNSLDKAKNKAVGNTFLDVVLQDAAGASFDIKELRGKFVLVDFWASWCGPCRKAFPELKELYDTLKGKDFVIIGISLDKNKDQWKAALSKEGLPWKQLIDEKGFNGQLALYYDIEAVPTGFLLDKEGRIMGTDLTIKEILEMIE